MRVIYAVVTFTVVWGSLLEKIRTVVWGS